MKDGEIVGPHTQNNCLKAKMQFMAECVFNVLLQHQQKIKNTVLKQDGGKLL